MALQEYANTLKGGSTVFIISWFIHTADHVRRGTVSTSDGVLWGGTAAAILATIALTLVFTNNEFAPFAVTAVFLSLAIGVSATHLLPGWGYLSEPLLIDSATDNWATAAAIGEILASLWLGLLGLRQLRVNNFQIQLETP